MEGSQRGMTRRQLWIMLVLVVILGGLLILSSIEDDLTRRDWLVRGGILLWALGPSLVGGYLGARVFSRCQTAVTAAARTAVTAGVFAMVTAAVTVLILEPSPVPRVRAGIPRVAVASDRTLLFVIQGMAAALVGGYCARHAAYLHVRRHPRPDLPPDPGEAPRPGKAPAPSRRRRRRR